MNPDPFDLDRFVQAQEPVYRQVLHELKQGEKQSHWMWYVFPQLAGLGTSLVARRYAIESAEEARGYLGHSVLGTRLHECEALLLGHEERGAEAIFGPVDAMKLKSSMTLFAQVSDEADNPFVHVLEKYFGGKRDERTLALLT